MGWYDPGDEESPVGETCLSFSAYVPEVQINTRLAYYNRMKEEQSKISLWKSVVF